jgi:hypothetical protein
MLEVTLESSMERALGLRPRMHRASVWEQVLTDTVLGAGNKCTYTTWLIVASVERQDFRNGGL